MYTVSEVDHLTQQVRCYRCGIPPPSALRARTERLCVFITALSSDKHPVMQRCFPVEWFNTLIKYVYCFFMLHLYLNQFFYPSGV